MMLLATERPPNWTVARSTTQTRVKPFKRRRTRANGVDSEARIESCNKKLVNGFYFDWLFIWLRIEVLHSHHPHHPHISMSFLRILRRLELRFSIFDTEASWCFCSRATANDCTIESRKNNIYTTVVSSIRKPHPLYLESRFIQIDTICYHHCNQPIPQIRNRWFATTSVRRILWNGNWVEIENSPQALTPLALVNASFWCRTASIK